MRVLSLLLILLVSPVFNDTIENITKLTYENDVYIAYENGTPVFYVNETKKFKVHPVYVYATGDLAEMVKKLGFRLSERFDLIVTYGDVDTDKMAVIFPNGSEGYNTTITWIKDPLCLKRSEVFAVKKLPEKGEIVARYEDGSVAAVKVGNKIYAGFKPNKEVLANLIYIHIVREEIPPIVYATVATASAATAGYAVYNLLKKFYKDALLAIHSAVIGILGYLNLFDKDEVLENDLRREIYNYILDNPGVHLREIQREFEVSLSTVTWHLRILEKAGLIRSSKVRNRLVYYPTGFRLDDVIMMLTLKNEVAERIVNYLARVGKTHLRKIATDLEISDETVRYNLRKLERAGIVLSEEEGNRIVYRLNPSALFVVKK